jgi:ABC-type lipoprotein release transport system permease subunit
MILALAWRNLWRHPRRTILNLAAIIFACVITIFMVSLQVGSYRSMIQHSLSLFDGYAQIQAPGFKEKPTIRQTISNPTALVSQLQTHPEIAQIGIRALTYGLLSSATRSYAAQVIGVQPANEPKISRLPQVINHQGRFLNNNQANEIVLGETLARNLQVQVGDEVALLGSTLAGSVAADVLSVVGIFRSGMPELDRQIVEIPLGRFQETFAMPNQAHTIVITTQSLSQLKPLLPLLRTSLSSNDLVIRDWNELQPGLKQAIQLDASMAVLFYLALIVIVIFSILNSLLMSILERTREFGVLLALGMRPRLLGDVIWLETGLLIFIGVSLGLLLGYALTQYFVITGIHFQEAGALLAQFGMPTKLYPEISSFSLLIGPSIIASCVALAGGLPTLRIYQLNPVNAMKNL